MSGLTGFSNKAWETPKTKFQIPSTKSQTPWRRARHVDRSVSEAGVWDIGIWNLFGL
jgi:hypothetical protein